ncbi:hydantoinase B/oxoprolinase family protein, partial [Streptomyces drozdowiczii]|uniref:hydantoinase B/oxoprolinase family protein n=1 Tax=Streptomyces drozdowiczii TaxID=202862 RepID=UPI0022455182
GRGVERRIRFLEPVTLALLTGHRRVPPYGMAGGGPGALGSQHIERADGSRTELAACDSADAGPGDVLVLRTPGSKMWGRGRGERGGLTGPPGAALLRRFDRCQCEDLICAP